MGILDWLFARKSGKYDFRKINRMLGQWEPYSGNDIIRGSRLPKYIDLPAKVKKWGDEPGRVPLSTAIFPYWLRLDPSRAGFLIKQKLAGQLYNEKTVPKKNGDSRIISVPAPILKFYQKRILTRLLEQVSTHHAAHGFIKGRSVFSAASPHVGKRVVLTMDLEDFFGTINFPRVTGLFASLDLKKKQALLLAGLCCYQGKLPQGAPTSPAISNLVCRRLDARLMGFADKNGFSYTRYADDLVFSGEDKLLRYLPVIRAIIIDEGFAPAEKKTFIKRSGGRQRVLGLNVNSKLSVPRKVRRMIRAMVHRQSGEVVFDQGMRDFLEGHIAFMKPAHPAQAESLKKELQGLC